MRSRWLDRVRRAARVVALALAAGCGQESDTAGRPVELTISAAVSLKDALEEIGREYEAGHPGVRLRFNFASSGTLQQQVERGAPVDVFLSAAEWQMDALEDKGLIVAGTRRAFAGNELVLVVPRDAPPRVRDFRDLAAPEVERVAIGAPASVPAGRYAEEVLRSLGIRDSVLAKSVRAQHVRQVLTYVARGEVDAGVVYRTDAQAIDRARIVASAPEGSHAPITYPLAVVAGTEHPGEAREFAAYLSGAGAQRVLQRHGFRPVR